MSAEPRSAEEALEFFVASWRSGDRVDPASFVARHADLGPELASAIDAWIAFERAGVREPAAEGTRIGPFRILREVGRGGMGVVYDAVEEPLGRRVALKVLPPASLASASAHGRFRRESELAARIDHPGVATVYGVGVEAERPWIAMRFIEGRTLEDAVVEARDGGASCVRVGIARAGAPSPRERDAVLAVAACIARVARALQAAHEHGVVHRDVKPSNVVVAADGTPVLVDFGLAIQEESSGHTLSRSGDHSGTPAYFAPELVSGDRPRSDAQTDVYALGVTLYECRALRRPFEAPTPVALFRAILHEQPADPRERNAAIQADLSVVVLTALERDRARRYATAAALAEDLEACVAGRPIRARPVPFVGRLARWARREPRQAVFAGAFAFAAVAALVLGGTWLSSRGEVHAAAEVARLRARDDALARGFVFRYEPDTSRAEFDRALALDPSSLDALAGQALAEIGAGRRQRAIELLATAPRTVGFEALRTLAEKRELSVEDSAATQIAVSALDLYLVAYVSFLESIPFSPGLGRPRCLRARKFVDEAILRSPEARQTYHALRANVADALGDEEMVRSAASSLLSLWPDSPSAWWSAATALVNVDPRAAIGLFERVTIADARNQFAFVGLGQCLTNVGRFEEAEVALRKGIALNSTASANNALGVALARRGCLDEAHEATERAVTLDPKFFPAWNNLGVYAQEEGDTELALRCFEETVALDPWYAGAHGTIGLILRRTGQPELALPHLEHAIGLDPVLSGQVWEQLTLTQADLGDMDAARASVEAGIAFCPDYRWLYDLRDALASER